MISITEIGITAGDIWHYLDDKGPATLGDLEKNLGKSREAILLSLGWLAREGHITLQGPDGDYLATLSKKA